jgi:hypothetical protein
VSGKGDDFAGPRLCDLRNEYLSDETFFIKLGRYERPYVKSTTEDSNHIRTSYLIGHNPEVGRPTQQRRAFKPNSGNKDSEQQDRRNQPANDPSPRSGIAEEAEIFVIFA